MNQKAERRGHAGNHLSRPVILIAYIHQQGTSWDQTGLVRVISVTNKSIKGQIISPNGILSTTQRLENGRDRNSNPHVMQWVDT